MVPPRWCSCWGAGRREAAWRAARHRPTVARLRQAPLPRLVEEGSAKVAEIDGERAIDDMGARGGANEHKKPGAAAGGAGKPNPTQTPRDKTARERASGRSADTMRTTGTGDETWRARAEQGERLGYTKDPGPDPCHPPMLWRERKKARQDDDDDRKTKKNETRQDEDGRAKRDGDTSTTGDEGDRQDSAEEKGAAGTHKNTADQAPNRTRTHTTRGRGQFAKTTTPPRASADCHKFACVIDDFWSMAQLRGRLHRHGHGPPWSVGAQRAQRWGEGPRASPPKWIASLPWLAWAVGPHKACNTEPPAPHDTAPTRGARPRHRKNVAARAAHMDSMGENTAHCDLIG